MASDRSSANPNPNPTEAPSPGSKRPRSPTSLHPNDPKQPRPDNPLQSLGKEIGMEDTSPNETKEEMHRTTPTNQQPETKDEILEGRENQGEGQKGKKKADRENEGKKEKVDKALPAVNPEQEGSNNESVHSTEGAPDSCLVELIVKSVMTNGSPLHTLETGAYSIYRYLNPDVRLPSINELKKDFIRVHQKEKSQLKKILKKQRVCLSTEIWVDKHGHDYHMSIWAHWINEEWELCNKVLSFSRIPDPVVEESESVEELSEIWENCLKDWEIESVLTVTVSKTCTEDGAVAYLKNRTSDKIGTVLGNEFLHLTSCTHAICEVVKVVLEAEKETIHKIRGTVSFVGFFGERYEHFKECTKKENLEHQVRLFVNEERMWDSVYMMLEKTTKLQKAFERLMKEDSLYLSCFYPPFCPPGDDDEHYDSWGNKIEKIVLTEPPTEADWENARHLAKILRLFYKAMRRLSSPLGTTSNLFLEEILGMHIRLTQLSKDEDQVLGAWAERVKKKFDEYWGDLFSLNPLFYVAQVLDPRKKLKYIRFYLNEIGFERSIIESFVERVEATLVRLDQAVP